MYVLFYFLQTATLLLGLTYAFVWSLCACFGCIQWRKWDGLVGKDWKCSQPDGRSELIVDLLFHLGVRCMQALTSRHKYWYVLVSGKICLGHCFGCMGQWDVAEQKYNECHSILKKQLLLTASLHWVYFFWPFGHFPYTSSWTCQRSSWLTISMPTSPWSQTTGYVA